MDALQAVAITLLGAAFGFVFAQLAKAKRWLRIATPAACVLIAASLLAVNAVLQPPDRTTIRLYLAFPVPGERFEVVPGTFPDIFSEYLVPTEPERLELTSRVPGKCRERSDRVTGRDDAWRCVTEGRAGTYDPCFKNVFREGQLLCVNSPWAASGVAIDLEEPLPDVGVMSTADLSPWAVETTNGARCVRSLGAAVQVGNVAFSYTCSTGDPLAPRGFLSEEFNSKEPVWTTFLAKGAGRTVEEVEILVAWV